MSLGPPKKRVHAVSRSHFLILSLTHSLRPLAPLFHHSPFFGPLLLALFWRQEGSAECVCVCGWSGAGLGAEWPRETVNTAFNGYIH